MKHRFAPSLPVSMRGPGARAGAADVIEMRQNFLVTSVTSGVGCDQDVEIGELSVPPRSSDLHIQRVTVTEGSFRGSNGTMTTSAVSSGISSPPKRSKKFLPATTRSGELVRGYTLPWARRWTADWYLWFFAGCPEAWS